jgi:hypothetical protein
VLPLLYLHGLSSGDFVPALGQFLGSSAALSASVISKLTETWKAEQRAFSRRDLSGVDYVPTATASPPSPGLTRSGTAPGAAATSASSPPPAS